MKDHKLGITKGKISVLEYAGIFCVQKGKFYGDQNILDCENTPIKEVLCNAVLIEDAFETANKCGKIPSELLEQRNELLSLIKEAKSTLEMWSDKAPAVSLIQDIDKIIQSIENEPNP